MTHDELLGTILTRLNALEEELAYIRGQLGLPMDKARPTQLEGTPGMDVDDNPPIG